MLVPGEDPRIGERGRDREGEEGLSWNDDGGGPDVDRGAERKRRGGGGGGRLKDNGGGEEEVADIGSAPSIELSFPNVDVWLSVNWVLRVTASVADVIIPGISWGNAEL